MYCLIACVNTSQWMETRRLPSRVELAVGDVVLHGVVHRVLDGRFDNVESENLADLGSMLLNFFLLRRRRQVKPECLSLASFFSCKSNIFEESIRKINLCRDFN
jgi:hypothetical protein